MFLTTQSFTNQLDGKSLLCKYNITAPVAPGYPTAYYFTEGKYYSRYIRRKKDKYSIGGSKTLLDYTTNDSDIKLLTHYKIIKRKTLIMMSDNYKEWGKCEVFNNHEDLNKKFNEIKIQLQKEYNKNLEGNKI